MFTDIKKKNNLQILRTLFLYTHFRQQTRKTHFAPTHNFGPKSTFLTWVPTCTLAIRNIVWYLIFWCYQIGLQEWLFVKGKQLQESSQIKSAEELPVHFLDSTPNLLQTFWSSPSISRFILQWDLLVWSWWLPSSWLISVGNIQSSAWKVGSP